MKLRTLILILMLLTACSKPTQQESNSASHAVDSVELDETIDTDSEIDEELALYSGQFEWYPEGGAEGGGSLSLEYRGNREFSFSLSTSLNECSASLEGTLYADRSQHAFYQSDECFLHFNFLLGNTIEIIEDSCREHPNECGFEGDYVRKN